VLRGGLLLAKEKGRLGQVMSDLHGVRDVLLGDPMIRGLFVSPRVDREKKEKRILDAFRSHVTEEVLGLLSILVRKGREPLLDNVVDYFDRLKDLAENRVHVHLSSARPVDPRTREAVEALVREASGKNPETHETLDPTLLGGLVVRVNDVVVDGSLRTRLRNMGRQLIGERR
jgi:F-type H+-transporting ATPase subunit delta